MTAVLVNIAITPLDNNNLYSIVAVSPFCIQLFACVFVSFPFYINIIIINIILLIDLYVRAWIYVTIYVTTKISIVIKTKSKCTVN